MTHRIIASRREFLASGVAGAAGLCLSSARADHASKGYDADKALIAITLDLEMSRNFPKWEVTHWDYEKGNLDEETKQYALEACRRVKARGGVLHSFAVGRVLEQENVDWLAEIAKMGHPIGNHTYDHINVTATTTKDLQFRFQRSPWLIEGKSVSQVIAENIRLTGVALKQRIGVEAAGFRTPGGFADGLSGHEEVQQLLLGQGFDWVSSKYPPHQIGGPGEPPTQAVLDSIVDAQKLAQPFVYPTDLIEVPMGPISDIGAFRGGRWKLDDFLKAIRLALNWTIEHRAVFDFLGHPSCLYVTDPEFQAIDLICDAVEQGGSRAQLVDLGTIAKRARQAP